MVATGGDMMSDDDERARWVFRLPEATCYVPAGSEEAARKALVANSYKGAPVHEWPLLSTRVTSRNALAASLLRPRAST